MKPIQVYAVLPNIAPESLADFKNVAVALLAQVRTEAGTLQHDWFFSDDQTRCVIFERYADSEALLAHLGNVGEMVGRLIELGGGAELNVCGDVSPDLRAAIAAMQPQIFTAYQSK